ncbi:MAG: prepilin peptidase [Peptostreptococcaceae bacterium]|nr:prepilin peptidase [Peptostreptococcaceae bacterium]
MIKGVLFAVILIVAGYIDIKTRTIPDWIHVLIMLVALIKIDLFDSLIGLVLVPLPFFMVACFKENSIGGGDIKLVAACGFFLGLPYGYLGCVLGLLVAVISNAIYYELNKKSKDIGFALAPYLGIGFIFVYTVKNIMV